MKKYFAKYLPVEGVIKEGDKKVIPSTGAIVTDYDDGAELNKFLETKKVKLFLCSRDIQAGDSCYSIPRNHYFKADFRTLKALENDEIGIIKVIGEISPDALGYVKEGDEFDEDAINIEAWDGEDIYDFSIDEWLTDEKDHLYESFKIEIKGPCGHFH